MGIYSCIGKNLDEVRDSLYQGRSGIILDPVRKDYGYRSGLNASMVRHLTQKIGKLEQFAELKAGDTVLDIGSNDATSLKAYQTPSLKRIGIDPTGAKFR